MKKIVLVLICVIFVLNLKAQTVIVQNTNYIDNSQPQRVVERVVEKPVYIEVQPTKSEPITLNGYLRVFPEDLGSFSEYPGDIIADINRNKAYGISTWRIPTDGELRVLIQNADKIGLNKICVRADLNGIAHDYMYWFKASNGKYVGAFEYYTTYHKIDTERIVRLVSSGY